MQPHQGHLGPPFAAFHSPHSLAFTYTTSAISRQTAHHLERHAAAAVAGPTGKAAAKALTQLRLLLITGAFFTMVAQFYDDTIAILRSLPRTFRIMSFGVCSGLAYKRFEALYDDKESAEYLDALSKMHAMWAERLVGVCRRNGGVYVKGAQFASAFGAIPREYRLQLCLMEDRAQPQPYKIIRKVLLAEMGPEAEGLFAEFEREATAAASLAQVHRARLRSGEEVAVKLQYPGLRSAVHADLRTIKALSTVAGWFFPSLSWAWICDELAKKLEIELDFRNEARNAQRLSSLMAGNRLVAVPHINEELSSRRAIVMEWIQGTKVNDVDSLERQLVNPRAVGLALVRLFAEMTFVHGYVHGDPHSGNVMVRVLGKPSFLHRLLRGSRRRFEIVLLDHGTYLSLDPVLREEFAMLWCAFVSGSKELQGQLASSLAGEKAGRVLPMLLTHSAKTREEERALQKQVGVSGVGDMVALMASAPRLLVELLQVNTVIRKTSNELGVTMEDRKCIFAWYARRGLPARSRREAHVPHIFNSLGYKLVLATKLMVWTGGLNLRYATRTFWGGVLGFFDDLLPGHKQAH